MGGGDGAGDGRGVRSALPRDAGPRPSERGRRYTVPPAQPALGGLQLPRQAGPHRPLDPDDLRIGQLSAGARGQLGPFPRPHIKHINNVFNRTVSFRRDSDVVVRHGVVSRRVQPLTPAQLQRAYSGQQSRDFSNYTAGNAEPDFSTQKNIFLAENFQAGQVGRLAPVVWFVSHCKDYNGRMKYVRRLQRYIGVDIYGDCGPLRCGSTRSMGHAYSLHQDPCFNLVNRKYK